jgi:hypothetical protein
LCAWPVAWPTVNHLALGKKPVCAPELHVK